MIKRIINFFDNHRITLVILILFLITLAFVSIKSYLFLHHDFIPLNCMSNINDEICNHNNMIIFTNPEKSKSAFFAQYNPEINKLQETYNLPEFNYYTAYYYELVSEIDYKLKNGREELYTFFNQFSNTYSLNDFYLKNTLYFDIFYYFRISIN